MIAVHYLNSAIDSVQFRMNSDKRTLIIIQTMMANAIFLYWIKIFIQRIMKAILKFDLTDVDEQEEHFRCIKSLEMALALYRIGKILSDTLDTSEDGQTINGVKLQQEIQDIFVNYDINLDKLIR